MNSTSQTASPVCPVAGEWLELFDARHREAPSDARLHAHLDACAACQQVVDDVRRYQTLLLRGRAPALTAEQRGSLDERVRLLAGHWQKPPRVSPGLAWGLALLAATVLVLVATRPWVERMHQNQLEFQQRVVEAMAPSAENPGAGAVTSLVEGDVQMAAADGRWRQLAGGDTLRFGQRLRNPARKGGPTARVVVPGRFELQLAPDTEVDVLAMADRDAFLRLHHGEVQCQVDKLRAGQRYSVMFAGFRAAVVGTRFVIRHDDSDSGVAVQVTEGAVRVDQADDPYAAPGDTLTMVRAGNRWQYVGGRMALEPIPAAPPLPAPAVPAPLPAVAPLAPPAALAAPATTEATPRTVEVTAPGAVRSPIRSAERPPTPLVSTGRGYNFPAPTALQPHAIVIEVPPQQMPPPEQVPVQAFGATKPEAPPIER